MPGGGVRDFLDHLESLRNEPFAIRAAAFRSTLAIVPMSYKIWRLFLKDATDQTLYSSPTSSERESLNSLFESCLVHLHKMPVIWLEYIAVLLPQARLTETRRVFDRALQSLPVTQHGRVWSVYIRFALESGVPELYSRVCKRYLMFLPAAREEHVQHLLDFSLWNDAVAQLSLLLDPAVSGGSAGATGAYSHFMKICDVISRHPGEITVVDVEGVLRSGIKKFSDERGRLWCALAEYYVRAGLFGKARDIYEEAISDVSTVRDFATIFDAFVQFEEALLTAKMSEGASVEDNSFSSSSSSSSSSNSDDVLEPASSIVLDLDDVDLRMARLELLLDRRPLLLSVVLLRQNPHNVTEWHKRAKLLEDAGVPSRVIATYNEAVKTVKSNQSIGKVFTLWVEWAKFYEKHNDVENARAVFRRGTDDLNIRLEDLATIWCEWAEMELRHENRSGALRVMQQAVSPPPSRLSSSSSSSSSSSAKVIDEDDVMEEGGSSVSGGKDGRNGKSNKNSSNSRHQQQRSSRAWGLYLDLEENLGTVATVKAAYDQAIALKVATPQMVLNYASYLEGRNFFEDSFRAFERGIAVFPWPHVRPLWLTYLSRYVARYGSSKLEQCRDLFETAVRECPSTEALPLYTAYAEFEEQHGSVRHVSSILDRCTRAVDMAHLYEAFLLFIRKVEENFGAAKTREIYERAVEELPDIQVKDMCLRFAGMETKLGELERARALYTHAASFCDPATHTAFWSQWQDWEVKNGSEETFRDMLRVKRSVAGKFATGAAVIAGIISSSQAMVPATKGKRAREDVQTVPQQQQQQQQQQPSVGALERMKMAKKTIN